MKAFITGYTGFLGQHLMRMLKGEYTVGLRRDVLGAGVSENPTVMVQGHLADAKRIERILSQYEIDTVFHLAAQTDVRIAHAEPLSTWESNVRGTWNLLEACRRQGVKRIIVASTDKAYGWTPPPYRETDAVRASGMYETSKTLADLCAQSYEKTYGMNVAITRCGNFYGPGRINWATLIPGTIKSIIERQKPVLRTDGSFRRDFMHVEDGARAYLMLATATPPPHGAFNFGTGTPMRVIDVVQDICAEMDWEGGITIIPTEKGEIVDQYLDTTRAQRELGWEPRIDWKKGLRDTILWYRNFLSATCD